MRRDIITTLCMDVVGNAHLRACPHPSTAVWEEPEPPPSERESAPHASRSDAHGALVALFCQAVRPGGRGQGLVFIWRLHYLAPATSERSPILVGLTGVLAVPLKPSMRAGAFGVSMAETSVACSKVLVFSTDAVPSALTTV